MKGMWLFVFGLLLTLGGVGGIEHSVTDVELMNAGAVAVVGLLIAGAGTLMTMVDNNS